MILSFSKDRFVDMIKSGHKVHTIREDKPNRWKPGMKIHFWRGNPRNVNAKVQPYQFMEGVCAGVQEIEIRSTKGLLNGKFDFVVYLEGELMDSLDRQALCVNDGLLPEQFRKWFVPNFPQTFKGKIIHWTDLRY